MIIDEELATWPSSDYSISHCPSAETVKETGVDPQHCKCHEHYGVRRNRARAPSSLIRTLLVSSIGNLLINCILIV